MVNLGSIAAEPDFKKPTIEDFFENDVFKFEYIINKHNYFVQPNKSILLFEHTLIHKNKNGKSINYLVTGFGRGIRKKKKTHLPYLLKKVHPYKYGKPSTKKTNIQVGYKYRLCSLVGSNVAYLKPKIPNFEAVILGCNGLPDLSSNNEHLFNLYELLELKGEWGKFKLLDYDEMKTTTSKDIDTMWFKLNTIASAVTIESGKERIILPGAGVGGVYENETDKGKYVIRYQDFDSGDRTNDSRIPYICSLNSSKPNPESITPFKIHTLNQKIYKKVIDKGYVKIEFSQKPSSYQYVNNLETLSGKKIKDWADYCPRI